MSAADLLSDNDDFHFFIYFLLAFPSRRNDSRHNKVSFYRHEMEIKIKRSACGK